MIDDIELPDDATRPVAPRLGNVTEEQRQPGRHLRMIHDHHRRNMQVLRDVIAAAEAGEMSAAEAQKAIEDLPLVQNYRRFGALCGQYCQIIHAHHSIEDAYMLPALSEKADGFRRVAERLKAEHDVVHQLLLRLIDTLNALMADPGPAPFAAAREIYATLERLLNSHFRYEEDSVGDALGYYGIGL